MQIVEWIEAEMRDDYGLGDGFGNRATGFVDALQELVGRGVDAVRWRQLVLDNRRRGPVAHAARVGFEAVKQR